jgi:hypothetical protein
MLVYPLRTWMPGGSALCLGNADNSNSDCYAPYEQRMSLASILRGKAAYREGVPYDQSYPATRIDLVIATVAAIAGMGVTYTVIARKPQKHHRGNEG